MNHYPPIILRKDMNIMSLSLFHMQMETISHRKKTEYIEGQYEGPVEQAQSK